MLRHAVATGDIKTAAVELDKLWQQRYKYGGFGLQQVSDAAWVLHHTSGDTAAHILLWPKLLSLLSRWAYSAAPRGPSATAAPAPRGPGVQQVVPSDSPAAPGAAVAALRSWLLAQLATRQLPWAAQAPALLFIAISSAGASSLTDRTEACGAIAASLQRLHRAREQSGAWPSPQGGARAGMPQGPTLGAADARELMSPASHAAVQDLCTAVQLMLEALANDGDARSFCGLLGDLAGGLGEAAAAAAAAAVVAGVRPGSEGLGSGPAAVRGSAAESAAAGVAAAAAAAAQQGLVAMAVLHGSCRQLGTAVVRAAAAVPQPGAGAAPATAPGSQAAGSASAGVRAQHGGVGSPAVRTLTTAAGMLQNGCSSGAADCTVGRTDPYSITILGMQCTAAGGMLEGCVLALWQLHPGRQGEVTRQLLPALQALASAIGTAAAAAAATAAGASTASEASAPGPGATGVTASGAASGALVLQSAVGLSWVRLRNLPPAAPDAVVPCPVRLAHMAAAGASAPSPAALPQSAQPVPSAGASNPLLSIPTPWHPARGALRLLLGGVLGLGPLLHEALSGAPPSAGAEWLRQHTGQQGPLFPEAQGLARSVLEALREAAAAAPLSGPAAGRQAQQPPLGAQGAPAVGGAAWVPGLIGDLAAATRDLHDTYSAVADTPYGSAWLAALQQPAVPPPPPDAPGPAAAPPPAEGASLRDVLDRTFVVVVGVAAAALDVVRQLPGGLPGAARAGGGGGGPGTGLVSDAQLACAVSLLGALADTQFCALQLRAHGELVAALGALVAGAPREAAGPLIALLPCYPALAAAYELNSVPVPASAAAAAAWQQHGVTPVGVVAGAGAAVAVSRLAFLLPLAASCVPYAPDVGAAASAVLPYVYLLLRDVREGVAQAAHTVWAALLSALCEPPKRLPQPPQLHQQRSGWLSCTVSRVASWALGDGAEAVRQGAGGRHGGSGGAGGPSEACLAIAEAMVPYYVERTLGQDAEEGPSQEGPVDGGRPATVTAADLDLLDRGLARVLQLLPPGHPVKSWCVQRIARQATQWAREEQNQQQDQQPQGGHTSEPIPQLRLAGEGVLSPASRAPAPAQLFGRSAALLASMVVRVDFPLLPLALRQLDELLAAVGTAERTVMLQAVQDAWVRSDDYARKPLIGEWLQRAVQVAIGVGGWSGGPDAGVGKGDGGAPVRRLRVLAAAFGVGRPPGQGGSVGVQLV